VQLDVAWEMVDIAADMPHYDRYAHSHPLVAMDSHELPFPFSFDELAIFVGRPELRKSAVRTLPAEPSAQGVDRAAQRLSVWFARHWLSIINLALAVYVGMPFLAPVLMKSGMTGPANVIYTVYRFMCHELPQRSYFLFGPQLVYTLPELVEIFGADKLPGFPFGGAFQAFVGNPEMGFKVALCQRDVAIYGTMLLLGLVFGSVRKRVKPLPFWLYILIGLVPIGLDGGSQLVSYIIPQWMPGGVPRESTWVLRTATGALFGLATMWLALPYLQESFTSIDEQLAGRNY